MTALAVFRPTCAVCFKLCLLKCVLLLCTYSANMTWLDLTWLPMFGMLHVREMIFHSPSGLAVLCICTPWEGVLVAKNALCWQQRRTVTLRVSDFTLRCIGVLVVYHSFIVYWFHSLLISVYLNIIERSGQLRVSGVRRKFSWGEFWFRVIWWSFVFGVRCLWRHNLTSFPCFQTNVLAKFLDIRMHIFLHPLPLFHVALHWI